MSANLVLTVMEILGLKLSGYYRWLRAAYSIDPALSKTLEQFDHEQRSMIALVQLEKNLVSQDPQRYQAVNLDPLDLKGAADNLDRQPRHAPPPLLGEALITAMEAERTLVEFAKDPSAGPTSRALADLLTQVRKISAGHQQTLREIIRARSLLAPVTVQEGGAPGSGRASGATSGS